MKKQELRKKYPKFIYQNYNYYISKKNLEICFNFKIEPNIAFKPKIIIENIDKNQIKKINKELLDNLIFHLGLIEIPSYWKLTCSQEIKIEAGYLSGSQINWWHYLIIYGLGQFFYENKINFKEKNFLKISAKPKPNYYKNFQNNISKKFKNRILIPIGGGKDSIVSLEVLKESGKNVQCFFLNPNEVSKKVIKTSKIKSPIIVRRELDEKLLKLNNQGFLNGHTPFSAYLAFLSILTAVIFDYKYIVFSNERSSNEGNLKYLGVIINHQWSKSFEFEKRFRNYYKKYLIKNVEYFSFLRPLYEIQIAQLFSKYKKYFFSFLSCNKAQKIASRTKKSKNNWCCNCPKCLFIFTILYPFISEKKLIQIFGENLFENKNLLPTMQELIGEKRFKPFECVGTKKESIVAFYLSFKKYIKNHKKTSSNNLPALLKYFKEKIIPKYKNLEKESKKIMNAWDNQNNLPKDFEIILKNTLKNYKNKI